LLPYIEQTTIYSGIDFRVDTDNRTLSDGTYIHQKIIPAFVCPSDQNSDLSAWSAATSNYSASLGPSVESWTGNPDCPCDASPWYAYSTWAGYPTHADGDPAGPFCRNSYNGNIYTCSMADVTDGLTNTMFFGETRRKCDYHTWNGWSRSNNGSGITGTLIPINFDTCHEQADAVPACNRNCTWNTEFGFRSAHPGGANFLLGDASVRFFPETMDHWVYQYIGAKDDGKAATLP
jgi:prepilin-type processing-associated H-X9-DG protein